MNINDLTLLFFVFQNNLKLFHFQTSRYGAHKASDKLYVKFEELCDKYIEVFQGKYGRIPAIDSAIKVNTFDYLEFEEFCEKYIVLLEGVSQGSAVMDDELKTILDDMIGEINRFLYLLSFE